MAQVQHSTLLQTTGILKKNACVVLISTEWNAAITAELEAGCRRQLEAAGVKRIISRVVPGAVEIPFAIKRYWDKCRKKKKPDAFVALGCVIKGDTPHFEYVCRLVTDGIGLLNFQLPVPVIFGVLTVNTEEQARERIGGKHGHKGEEAAMTALKMINFNETEC